MDTKTLLEIIKYLRERKDIIDLRTANELKEYLRHHKITVDTYDDLEQIKESYNAIEDYLCGDGVLTMDLLSTVAGGGGAEQIHTRKLIGEAHFGKASDFGTGLNPGSKLELLALDLTVPNHHELHDEHRHDLNQTLDLARPQEQVDDLHRQITPDMLKTERENLRHVKGLDNVARPYEQENTIEQRKTVETMEPKLSEKHTEPYEKAHEQHETKVRPEVRQTADAHDKNFEPAAKRQHVDTEDLNIHEQSTERNSHEVLEIGEKTHANLTDAMVERQAHADLGKQVHSLKEFRQVYDGANFREKLDPYSLERFREDIASLRDLGVKDLRTDRVLDSLKDAIDAKWKLKKNAGYPEMVNGITKEELISRIENRIDELAQETLALIYSAAEGKPLELGIYEDLGIGLKGGGFGEGSSSPEWSPIESPEPSPVASPSPGVPDVDLPGTDVTKIVIGEGVDAQGFSVRYDIYGEEAYFSIYDYDRKVVILGCCLDSNTGEMSVSINFDVGTIEESKKKMLINILKRISGRAQGDRVFPSLFDSLKNSEEIKTAKVVLRGLLKLKTDSKQFFQIQLDSILTNPKLNFNEEGNTIADSLANLIAAHAKDDAFLQTALAKVASFNDMTVEQMQLFITKVIAKSSESSESSERLGGILAYVQSLNEDTLNGISVNDELKAAILNLHLKENQDNLYNEKWLTALSSLDAYDLENLNLPDDAKFLCRCLNAVRGFEKSTIIGDNNLADVFKTCYGVEFDEALERLGEWIVKLNYNLSEELIGKIGRSFTSRGTNIQKVYDFVEKVLKDKKWPSEDFFNRVFTLNFIEKKSYETANKDQMIDFLTRLGIEVNGSLEDNARLISLRGIDYGGLFLSPELTECAIEVNKGKINAIINAETRTFEGEEGQPSYELLVIKVDDKKSKLEVYSLNGEECKKEEIIFTDPQKKHLLNVKYYGLLRKLGLETVTSPDELYEKYFNPDGVDRNNLVELLEADELYPPDEPLPTEIYSGLPYGNSPATHTTSSSSDLSRASSTSPERILTFEQRVQEIQEQHEAKKEQKRTEADQAAITKALAFWSIEGEKIEPTSLPWEKMQTRYEFLLHGELSLDLGIDDTVLMCTRDVIKNIPVKESSAPVLKSLIATANSKTVTDEVFNEIKKILGKGTETWTREELMRVADIIEGSSLYVLRVLIEVARNNNIDDVVFDNIRHILKNGLQDMSCASLGEFEFACLTEALERVASRVCGEQIRSTGIFNGTNDESPLETPIYDANGKIDPDSLITFLNNEEHKKTLTEAIGNRLGKDYADRVTEIAETVCNTKNKSDKDLLKVLGSELVIMLSACEEGFVKPKKETDFPTDLYKVDENGKLTGNHTALSKKLEKFTGAKIPGTQFKNSVDVRKDEYQVAKAFESYQKTLATLCPEFNVTDGDGNHYLYARRMLPQSFREKFAWLRERRIDLLVRLDKDGLKRVCIRSKINDGTIRYFGTGIFKTSEYRNDDDVFRKLEAFWLGGTVNMGDIVVKFHPNNRGGEFERNRAKFQGGSPYNFRDSTSVNYNQDDREFYGEAYSQLKKNDPEPPTNWVERFSQEIESLEKVEYDYDKYIEKLFETKKDEAPENRIAYIDKFAQKFAEKIPSLKNLEGTLEKISTAIDLANKHGIQTPNLEALREVVIDRISYLKHGQFIDALYNDEKDPLRVLCSGKEREWFEENFVFYNDKYYQKFALNEDCVGFLTNLEDEEKLDLALFREYFKAIVKESGYIKEDLDLYVRKDANVIKVVFVEKGKKQPVVFNQAVCESQRNLVVPLKVEEINIKVIDYMLRKLKSVEYLKYDANNSSFSSQKDLYKILLTHYCKYSSAQADEKKIEVLKARINQINAIASYGKPEEGSKSTDKPAEIINENVLLEALKGKLKQDYVIPAVNYLYQHRNLVKGEVKAELKRIKRIAESLNINGQTEQLIKSIDEILKTQGQLSTQSTPNARQMSLPDVRPQPLEVVEAMQHHGSFYHAGGNLLPQFAEKTDEELVEILLKAKVTQLEGKTDLPIVTSLPTNLREVTSEQFDAMMALSDAANKANSKNISEIFSLLNAWHDEEVTPVTKEFIEALWKNAFASAYGGECELRGGRLISEEKAMQVLIKGVKLEYFEILVGQLKLKVISEAERQENSEYISWLSISDASQQLLVEHKLVETNSLDSMGVTKVAKILEILINCKIISKEDEPIARILLNGTSLEEEFIPKPDVNISKKDFECKLDKLESFLRYFIGSEELKQSLGEGYKIDDQITETDASIKAYRDAKDGIGPKAREAMKPEKSEYTSFEFSDSPAVRQALRNEEYERLEEAIDQDVQEAKRKLLENISKLPLELMKGVISGFKDNIDSLTQTDYSALKAAISSYIPEKTDEKLLSLLTGLKGENNLGYTARFVSYYASGLAEYIGLEPQFLIGVISENINNQEFLNNIEKFINIIKKFGWYENSPISRDGFVRFIREMANLSPEERNIYLLETRIALANDGTDEGIAEALRLTWNFNALIFESDTLKSAWNLFYQKLVGEVLKNHEGVGSRKLNEEQTFQQVLEFELEPEAETPEQKLTQLEANLQTAIKEVRTAEKRLEEAREELNKAKEETKEETEEKQTNVKAYEVALELKEKVLNQAERALKEFEEPFSQYKRVIASISHIFDGEDRKPQEITELEQVRGKLEKDERETLWETAITFLSLPDTNFDEWLKNNILSAKQCDWTIRYLNDHSEERLREGQTKKSVIEQLEEREKKLIEDSITSQENINDMTDIREIRYILGYLEGHQDFKLSEGQIKEDVINRLKVREVQLLIDKKDLIDKLTIEDARHILDRIEWSLDKKNTIVEKASQLDEFRNQLESHFIETIEDALYIIYELKAGVEGIYVSLPDDARKQLEAKAARTLRDAYDLMDRLNKTRAFWERKNLDKMVFYFGKNGVITGREIRNMLKGMSLDHREVNLADINWRDFYALERISMEYQVNRMLRFYRVDEKAVRDSLEVNIKDSTYGINLSGGTIESSIPVELDDSTKACLNHYIANGHKISAHTQLRRLNARLRETNDRTERFKLEYLIKLIREKNCKLLEIGEGVNASVLVISYANMIEITNNNIDFKYGYSKIILEQFEKFLNAVELYIYLFSNTSWFQKLWYGNAGVNIVDRFYRLKDTKYVDEDHTRTVGFGKEGSKTLSDGEIALNIKLMDDLFKTNSAGLLGEKADVIFSENDDAYIIKAETLAYILSEEGGSITAEISRKKTEEEIAIYKEVAKLMASYPYFEVDYLNKSTPTAIFEHFERYSYEKGGMLTEILNTPKARKAARGLISYDSKNKQEQIVTPLLQFIAAAGMEKLPKDLTVFDWLEGMVRTKKDADHSAVEFRKVNDREFNRGVKNELRNMLLPIVDATQGLMKVQEGDQALGGLFNVPMDLIEGEMFNRQGPKEQVKATTPAGFATLFSEEIVKFLNDGTVEKFKEKLIEYCKASSIDVKEKNELSSVLKLILEKNSIYMKDMPEEISKDYLLKKLYELKSNTFWLKLSKLEEIQGLIDRVQKAKKGEIKELYKEVEEKFGIKLDETYSASNVIKYILRQCIVDEVMEKIEKAEEGTTTLKNLKSRLKDDDYNEGLRWLINLAITGISKEKSGKNVELAFKKVYAAAVEDLGLFSFTTVRDTSAAEIYEAEGSALSRSKSDSTAYTANFYQIVGFFNRLSMELYNQGILRNDMELKEKIKIYKKYVKAFTQIVNVVFKRVQHKARAGKIDKNAVLAESSMALYLGYCIQEINAGNGVTVSSEETFKVNKYLGVKKAYFLRKEPPSIAAIPVEELDVD